VLAWTPSVWRSRSTRANTRPVIGLMLALCDWSAPRGPSEKPDLAPYLAE
jgi:hypothetical protein